MSEALEGWTEFNVAMVGATAALAGLLIVAMSVNIGEIMKSPTLPSRAAASIATLVLAIVAGALGLMPGQLTWAYGAEVLVATLVAAAFQVHAIRVISRDAHVSTGVRVLKAVSGLVPIAAFLAGAVLILAGVAGAGLVAVAIGSVLAVVAAILMAWVVLVEVLR
ncbi:hypothetical protein J7E25_07955 [Agromyces sp. ISL-38]|uniref:hypothetical protein n=1 Tax=Agromyces sp. ISL-38 TaxID=2819107 RepID=UPI001BEA16FA|nr:hypothetical protein [Agromyces sp. ISL-38]MBT2499029.1 hypothetical protein [Agromyces sp. ISL-38]MBT2518426.1 hypothetical protein [Streptomyces sp. ISL-90]